MTMQIMSVQLYSFFNNINVTSNNISYYSLHFFSFLDGLMLKQFLCLRVLLAFPYVLVVPIWSTFYGTTADV